MSPWATRSERRTPLRVSPTSTATPSGSSTIERATCSSTARGAAFDAVTRVLFGHLALVGAGPGRGVGERRIDVVELLAFVELVFVLGVLEVLEVLVAVGPVWSVFTAG